MDETITRSAGAAHGQEMTPATMEAIIRSIGRIPRQRDTLYSDVPDERYRASFAASQADVLEVASASRREHADTSALPAKNPIVPMIVRFYDGFSLLCRAR